jgi:two-component system phosphate regulon sensor histidine kinase PhoR
MAYSHQLIDLWEACAAAREEQSDTVETARYGNFLHVVITPLRASDPPRYLIMLQDLTHIRRLETVRRDFISNISHELRTPLASLALVVETLRDGAIEEPPAARRFLTYMETELAAVTQMVEELLELSRIESGRVPLTLKATKIGELLRKPVKRLQPQADRKGVSLDLKIPDGVPRALADEKRIHQVVTNLVHNAIKFTPSGGAIVVFVRVQPFEPLDDDWRTAGRGRSLASRMAVDVSTTEEIVIGVTDTGVGIPEEDLSRIFERFYKTDPARSQEGTGLGLSIARHIVHGHGGRIWVESTEGVGSTFFFALPVAT